MVQVADWPEWIHAAGFFAGGPCNLKLVTIYS